MTWLTDVVAQLAAPILREAGTALIRLADQLDAAAQAVELAGRLVS